MLKTVVKLAVLVFVGNAVWRTGSTYVADFRFQDSVRAAAAFEAKTDDELHQQILALAARYNVPLTADAFTIARQPDDRVVVDGAYVKPVLLLPGYEYPWRLPVRVEAKVAHSKPTGLNELKELVGGPSTNDH